MQSMHFSAIFGMLAVLTTSVTPWYPLCVSGDVVTVYAY